MAAGILQATRHLGRKDVSRDPHHEQLAEAGVEDPLRRHPRIAATQYRREGMLPPGQFGHGLARQAKEMSLSLQKSFVAVDQALEGFVGGNVGVAHGCLIIASITWSSRIFMMVPVGKVIA